jgi:hypothetical protein
MFLIFMFVVRPNGRACAFRDTTARLRSKKAERHRGTKHGTIHKTTVRRAVTRRAYRVLGQGRATTEARYAYETRLWELEQQFEVKAAKVREEYLAALLEIHASEANGNQHAHHS